MDKKQAQMKQQIAMMLRKKEYYDILGIQKTATQQQIKKSYKKLALRFHPDKNSTEGSKQVFKKVTSAYSVLVNAQQKQRYDRYGPQQQQQARYRPQRRQSQQGGDQQFDEFDQIFKAFFGMNNLRPQRGQGQQFRSYSFNMGGGHAHHQVPRNQQGFGFGYIFIVFFIIYVITPFFKTQPYYSMNISSEYRFKVSTQILKTPYYVRQQFLTQNKKDNNFKKQIDIQVDQNYLNTLKKNCDQATNYKKRIEYQAYQYRPGQYRDYYLSEAQKVDMSHCKKLDGAIKNHPQYISQLYNYR